MFDSYLTLFGVAFAAATLVPAASEVLLAGLLAAGRDPVALWCWATAGNTLGAAVNWAMGRYLACFRERPWFPVKPAALAPARRWFQRYGAWSLLLAWMPGVGDALTLVAGLLGVPFLWFLFLTACGKGARYALVLGAALGLGL